MQRLIEDEQQYKKGEERKTWGNDSILAYRKNNYLKEKQTMSDKKEGTVKWFNNSKGYGFIQVEGEKDYFVHMNEFLMEGFKTLAEDQKVEFEVGEGPKGPVAKKVNPL